MTSRLSLDDILPLSRGLVDDAGGVLSMRRRLDILEEISEVLGAHAAEDAAASFLELIDLCKLLKNSPSAFLMKAELSGNMDKYRAVCAMAMSVGYGEMLKTYASGNGKWKKLLEDMGIFDMLDYLVYLDLPQK